MAKKIIGTDGQADQRGKSHSIVLRAVLLCAGLVLAGCGTQEDGQAESRQEEQMKGQSEERSDEKSRKDRAKAGWRIRRENRGRRFLKFLRSCWNTGA